MSPPTPQREIHFGPYVKYSAYLLPQRKESGKVTSTGVKLPLCCLP